MASKKRVLILGATGSIGTQTIDVCNHLKDEFEICGMTAHSNESKLLQLAHDNNVSNTTCDVESLVSFIDYCEPDIVINSLVGACGVECSYHTLTTTARLALANKESLVVAGDLLMPLAQDDGKLTPIDSEHGAIYQCLIGESNSFVSKLWITCSGGPFLGKTKDELAKVKAGDALKHPTWNMGAKITIDSATLMNKGLEVIEAHHLFNCSFDKIKVVIHPQSVIHSMVEFIDGSVKAHLGTTDMRIPIEYALTHPMRRTSPVEPLDFTRLGSISFDSPDYETFGCLKIAYEAGSAGGILPCVMNAANEVANAAFRDGKCRFIDIEDCVRFAISEIKNENAVSLEQLKIADSKARTLAADFLKLK